MALLFTITFTFGVMIGMIIYITVFRNQPPKENPKNTAIPEEPKRKDIRDFCINLTHYTHEQLKEVYELLRELREPISTVYKDYKDWWEDGYDPDMYKQTYTYDYLGFNSKSWGIMVNFEITDKGRIIDLHDFLIILRIKLIERENPRYKLWEYFQEQHNLILIDSEIDEIIYRVNRINDGKETNINPNSST